jgi:CBS domain containing-hemolysin-like protein
MVEPLMIPDTVELDPLLAQLRAGGLQMAVVVNEFGGFDGIVTLEDLVEEIVGEVRDEHDEADDSVRRESDGSWTISGLLRPDEVGRAVGVVLPEDEEYETVAGLVTLELGRMAEAGDEVTVEGVDFERARQLITLTVVSLDGLRIDRLRLRHEPIVEETDEPEEDDA